MQPEWKGSQPQRFSGGRRTFQIQNQLGLGLSFTQCHNPHPSGIRSFSPSLSPQSQYRPHMRTFESQYNTITKQIDYRGIKHVGLPEQKERTRPERLHLRGGEECGNQINFKGLRVYDEANRSRDKHYFVEEQMQRKGRLDSIEKLRNSIRLTSLGDKPYRYPQYSLNFYNSGGLIAGSTHKPRKQQIIPQIKKGSVMSRPNYDTIVKQQEQRQERTYLDSIDNWEQTTLKENNPGWNDPETFFQREAAKNGTGKDIKKGGKK